MWVSMVWPRYQYSVLVKMTKFGRECRNKAGYMNVGIRVTVSM